MDADDIEFTVKDALDEISAAMAKVARPLDSEYSAGWRTVRQITEASGEDILLETMRKRVDRCVEKGLFERMKIGARSYYRMVKDV